MYFILFSLLLSSPVSSNKDSFINEQKEDACSLVISKHLPFCSCVLHTMINSYALRCEKYHNGNSFLNYSTLLFENETIKFFHTIYNTKNINIIKRHSFDNFIIDISNYNQTLLTIGKYISSYEFFYHLIFGNIVEIEDYAFKAIKFYENLNLSNINYEKENMNTNDFNLNIKTYHLKLRVQFVNSSFVNNDMKNPFFGLNALKLEFLNLTNSYLINSFFDSAIIGNLYLKSCKSFIGFEGLSDSSYGKLINSFQVSLSYNTTILSENQLPPFIAVDTFRYISITYCYKLKEIAAFAFSKYNNLQELDLKFNSIQYIHEDAFRNLFNLEKLDLSYNQYLEVIDKRFQDLNSLKFLYLTKTSIKNINDNSFIGLNKLYELDLSKSYKLDKIDQYAFKTCKKSLKILNLSESKQKLIMKTIDDINWLSGLPLNYLYIDQTYNSNIINDIFASDAEVLPLSCKIMRTIMPRRTFVIFNDQKCDCLKHWLYR